MSFIDDSEQNMEKYVSSLKEENKSVPLLKEQTGGSVAGFVGGAGMGIDALFAGPFHPDSGYGSKNKQLLAKQLKDRRKKRKDLETDRDGVIDDYSGIPDPVGGYYETETELIALAYDELLNTNELNKQYNDEMTPPQDTKWVEVDINYHYDDTYINRSEKNIKHFDVKIKYDEKPTYANKNFINSSETNMENVGIEIKYDDIHQYTNKNYVNKSATNWKIINRG